MMDEMTTTHHNARARRTKESARRTDKSAKAVHRTCPAVSVQPVVQKPMPTHAVGSADTTRPRPSQVITRCRPSSHGPSSSDARSLSRQGRPSVEEPVARRLPGSRDHRCRSFLCREGARGHRLSGDGDRATWAFFAVSIFALFFLAVIWKMQLTEAYDRAVESDWGSILQAEMGGSRGR
jgi:hypothetical protein